MEGEGIYYHALVRSAERGYTALRKLRSEFGSWRKAWAELRPPLDPEEEWRALESSGIKLLLPEDPAYPPLLREIPLPPFGIYVKGQISPGPCLGIVGTRKGTETGRRIAFEFAARCSVQVSIVSGLAMGIDAAAHKGALQAGGRTIAVLAGGLDQVYPKMNLGLAREILVKNGALLSEYPPGTTPKPFRFLERNRLISGLCRGILIVEASDRSGSLATARFATDQNRDVFVIPGPHSHPNYRGSHSLIRQGAELVTEPGHILESLGLADSQPETEAESREEALVRLTLQNSVAPLNVDKISELTHLKAHVVVQTLAFLELKGRVREDGPGYVCA